MDSVIEAVCQDLKDRSAKGLTKYGVTLDRQDLSLRDWLQHAYEECLDQANYLKRAIMESDDNSPAKFRKSKNTPWDVNIPKSGKTEPVAPTDWRDAEIGEVANKQLEGLKKAGRQLKKDLEPIFAKIYEDSFNSRNKK